MLKLAFEEVEINVKSGFRACGIVPFAPDKFLNKIPDHEEVTGSGEKWLDAFTNHLKKSRKDETSTSQARKEVKD